MSTDSQHRPRVIAFHLPQFHPIPENDCWWGKGFTEWTNVARARPLFTGHYQPRLPADLGFYDLRLPDALQAQADLAREHGIHGFCYHYYWFKGGKRLLERPLEQMLASGKPDFPFCLCWANENWTRRWDGQESEVLMAQEHDAESDIAFLHSVLPYFNDPRHIRIGGRPLLVIYRTALFPDLTATVSRWRSEMERLGELPPYLVAAESLNFNTVDTAEAGFDATCEFPPHGNRVALLGKAKGPQFPGAFSGAVIDYRRLVDHFLSRPMPEHRRFPGVTLNWDNTARRKSAASITVNFSVNQYHRWLSGALESARSTAPPDEQFVFINAWNEWAEGTYLEPDQLYGHAYLEATRAAILGQAFHGREITPADEPSPVLETPPSEAGAASPSLAPTPCFAGRLRLVGIAMVGNEADIVEAFVRENLRYLDHLLIADHNSLDGTREILAELVTEGLPITIKRIDAPAFLQTKVTNQLLYAALEQLSPDWILPLDADEFLDAHSRSALEEELANTSRQHALIPWVTHVPTAFDDAAEPHPLKRVSHRYAYPTPTPEENPWVWKLIVNASLFAPYLDRYDLEKGSHRIVFRGSKEPSCQPAQPLTGTRLRHYPVRSYDQLAAKVGIGEAQKFLSSIEAERAGAHWPSMLQGILGCQSNIQLLQGACREYLDTGRTTAEVPIIVEPLVPHEELRLRHHQVPVSGLFVRWIQRVFRGPAT